jgi:hypothetical protein
MHMFNVLVEQGSTLNQMKVDRSCEKQFSDQAFTLIIWLMDRNQNPTLSIFWRARKLFHVVCWCHCKKMIVSEHPHCNVERSNALRSLTGARCLKWMSTVVVTGSVTVTTTIMLSVAPTKVSPYFGSLLEATGWTLCLSASFELGFTRTT